MTNMFRTTQELCVYITSKKLQTAAHNCSEKETYLHTWLTWTLTFESSVVWWIFNIIRKAFPFCRKTALVILCYNFSIDFWHFSRAPWALPCHASTASLRGESEQEMSATKRDCTFMCRNTDRYRKGDRYLRSERTFQNIKTKRKVKSDKNWKWETERPRGVGMADDPRSKMMWDDGS